MRRLFDFGGLLPQGVPPVLFPTIRPARIWGRDGDRSYLSFPPWCHVANRHVEFSGPAFLLPAFVHMSICFARHGFLRLGHPADPARRAAKRHTDRAARNVEDPARNWADASDPCRRRCHPDWAAPFGGSSPAAHNRAPPVLLGAVQSPTSSTGSDCPTSFHRISVRGAA